MSVNVKCDGCGKSYRAKDEHAGRQVKCPNCGRLLTVPSSVPIAPSLPRAEPVDQAVGTGTPSQRDTKPCPFCGEEILAAAKKCKHCRGYLAPSAGPAQGHRPDPARLRGELQEIEQERKRNNALGFLFGIPGFSLMLLAHFMSDPRPEMLALTWILATALFGVGLVYVAKYKGRNPAWALVGLFVCFGLIIMLVLKDFKAERITEIKATLSAMGESV